jgi:glucosamine-6-phosphate deaminase
VTTYVELARVVAERGLDLRHLVIVMMDEYVTDRYNSVARTLPHSCRRFGQEMIVEPLTEAAGSGKGVLAENFLVPDPREPERYDQQLAAIGGVDLFILASGASDGHVGFNPPGSARDTTTRVVRLADTTRSDNLATFPSLGTLDQVPRYGVTVGINTILRYSKSAVMIVHGAHKAEAAARLRSAEQYDPGWPATVITECSDPALFVDTAAANSKGDTHGPDQARLSRRGIDSRGRHDGVVRPPR